MRCCAAARARGAPLIDEVKSQTLDTPPWLLGALDRPLRRGDGARHRHGERPRAALDLTVKRRRAVGDAARRRVLPTGSVRTMRRGR
jgi:16S rRNA (cytosine967-C5)-methyltransferase